MLFGLTQLLSMITNVRRGNHASLASGNDGLQQINNKRHVHNKNNPRDDLSMVPLEEGAGLDWLSVRFPLSKLTLPIWR
jgi:hypothetical protein